MTDLEFLYQQTVQARRTLLAYCATLPPEVFTATEPEYGQGSMRDTLAHVAGCYSSWTGRVGLDAPLPRVAPADLPDVSAVSARFELVDQLVHRALGSFDRWDTPFTWTAPSGKVHTVTPRWLILHPVTHEFHHKGQIVTLGRKLGHPVSPEFDTDLPPEGGW